MDTLIIGYGLIGIGAVTAIAAIAGWVRYARTPKPCPRCALRHRADAFALPTIADLRSRRNNDRT